LHKFAVGLAAIAVLLFCGWLFSGKKTETKEEAVYVTAPDGSSVSLKDMKDPRTIEKRRQDYAKDKMAEWRWWQQIIAKAREIVLAESEGQRAVNTEIAKELNTRGRDVDLEAEAVARMKIAQKRAEIDRKHNEENDARITRDVNERSDIKEFKQIEIEDSGSRVRFEEALKDLQKALRVAGGMVDIGLEEQRTAAAAKAAVLEELNHLLAALPTRKHMMAWLARQEKDVGAARLQEQVRKNWEAFLRECQRQDSPAWCWVKFVRAEEGIGVEKVIADIRTAFQNYRFHDAVALTETVVSYVLHRVPPPPPPPGFNAEKRLPTSCVQIGTEGYLAVAETAFPHGSLGPIVREEPNDYRAPNARFCVWGWRVSNNDGWSLHCANYPEGPFNGVKSERRGADLAAPDPKILPVAKFPAYLPDPATRAIVQGCRRALVELTSQPIGPRSVRAEELLPRLENIVNRPR
jgi:hypothetical protein